MNAQQGTSTGAAQAQPLLSEKKISLLATIIFLLIIVSGVSKAFPTFLQKVGAGKGNASLPAIWPVCANAQDFPIPEDKEVGEMPMPTKCFSGFIQTPLRGWPGWEADSSPRKDFMIWFRGQPYPTPIAGGKSADPKTSELYSFPGQYEFRVMGSEEGMTFVVRRVEKEVRMEIRKSGEAPGAEQNTQEK